MKKILLCISVMLISILFAFSALASDSAIDSDIESCTGVYVYYRNGGPVRPDAVLMQPLEYTYETDDKSEFEKITECIDSMELTAISADEFYTVYDGETLLIEFMGTQKDVYFNLTHNQVESGDEFYKFNPEDYQALDNLIYSFRNKDNVNVYVDGRLIKSDYEVQLMGGRTLMPAQNISKALGAQFEWDYETDSAIIALGEKRLEFFPGQNLLKVNGEEAEIDVGAAVINHYALVPVRVLSEKLGFVVDWQDGTVIIQSVK